MVQSVVALRALWKRLPSSSLLADARTFFSSVPSTCTTSLVGGVSVSRVGISNGLLGLLFRKDLACEQAYDLWRSKASLWTCKTMPLVWYWMVALGEYTDS